MYIYVVGCVPLPFLTTFLYSCAILCPPCTTWSAVGASLCAICFHITAVTAGTGKAGRFLHTRLLARLSGEIYGHFACLCARHTFQACNRHLPARRTFNFNASISTQCHMYVAYISLSVKHNITFTTELGIELL